MSLKLYEKRMDRLHSLLEDETKEPSNMPLVAHLSDEHIQAVISGIIDCQREDNKSPHLPEFLKMISLPATVHALASMPHDLFSIQPTTKEDDLLFYFDKAGVAESIKGIKRHCIVRPSMTVADLSELPHDEMVRHLLDLACAVCEEATVQLLREMIKPNKYNKTLKTSDDLLDSIYEMSEGIHERIGRSANFLVMPVHFAHALQHDIKTYYDFDVLPINIRPIGVLKNRWKVYISSHIGQDKVLVGYRGHHPADAGLVMSPESFFAHPKPGVDKKRKFGDQGIKTWTLNFRGATELVQPHYFRTIVVKADKKPDTTFDL